MRSLSVFSLSYMILWVSATPFPARKSLRFASLHPTARFVTEPPALSFSAEADPFDVARSFLEQYTHSNYYIRNDSYTDKLTRVTHVYVRQLVDGLEVADGNVNLNIRDGRVLSYGDSFFQGSAPTFGSRPTASHATYCADLARGATRPININADQFVMTETSHVWDEFYAVHCIRPLSAVREAAAANAHAPEQDSRDPRRAALYFMITAHPDSSAVEQLIRNFDATLDGMTISYDHSLPEHQSSIIISGLAGTTQPVKARAVYVQTPTQDNATELHKSWRLEVQMEDNWYEAYLSVDDPSTVISVIDWACDSAIPHGDGYPNALEAKLAMGLPINYTDRGAYKVWKLGINDPESGERTVELAPYDQVASPFGWHTISKANNLNESPGWVGKGDKQHDNDKYLNFTTTWGNNVLAQENWENRENLTWIQNHRPEGGPSLEFKFEYNPQVQPSGVSGTHGTNYVDLAVTQLFYTSNMIHDLYYRYGFDEAAGNFQQDNYGRGGLGGDAVIAHAQDKSGYNNANFMTPPDGQNGLCRMYLWDASSPYRDGDLDAGVLIHELTHGLTNRLTGGPANSGCLATWESAGMGEGLGDFMATLIRSGEKYHDFAVGSWVSNRTGGLRYYPYSKNNITNPSTYKSVDGPRYFWSLHAIGEVWAEILWVVLQHMIKQHGFSSTLFPPVPLWDGSIPTGEFFHPAVAGKPLVPKHGNTLMIQLIVTAMKLQPCRSSFFNARDAIIEADKVLTGGKNLCVLWAGFSERGLGTDAVFLDQIPWGQQARTNGFKVPDACK
ncbi:extracellular elastinolytic metalloproteinase [Rhizoctonia solani 123E]|uniref:Extracellular metalloproteinase n=1 Tax=Rhizoctonia solani 123E TaxID=1423351 RepID=A0A074RM36_9AGAM|nr:extracellular elastinolytic metalloproteinase [Rhizoctonia solani 123E]